MSLPPVQFNVTFTNLPAVFRRGDAVTLTIAACRQHDIPDSSRGVIKDIWIESGKALLLVEAATCDRRIEATVAPDGVLREA